MSEAFRFSAQLEDDHITHLLWDYGCQGLMQDGDELVAYFPTRQDLPLAGRWESVAHDGYLEAYYASLQAVYLQRLVVAPTHNEVRLTAGQKVLWLDPGMAFGSGHHETTRLALEQLEQLLLVGKHVLDVGAGSGILAIAADLLGAASSQGIDNDPLTIPIAQDNAALNLSRASFVEATLDTVAECSTDVIIANLFAELHIELMADYQRVLKAGGTVILTGILQSKLAAVQQAFEQIFHNGSVSTVGEWALVAGKA